MRDKVGCEHPNRSSRRNGRNGLSKKKSGGGGNRTRVRGRTGQSIYKRSLGFDFARRPVPRRPTDGLAILKRRTAGDWLSLGAEPERWRRYPGLGPNQERRRQL